MARNPQRLPYPDTWRARRLEVEDALTSITKDSSGNLKFTDAVSGSKTLAELVAGSLPSGNQGAILYKDAAAWAALAPGTSGQFLKTNGAAANPSWGAGGGSWAVIASTTLTGTATSVDFTGLDLDTDNEYWLQFTAHVNSAGSPDTYLYCNDDTTNTNYYTQRFIAYSSTVYTVRTNDPWLAQINGNENFFYNIYISRDIHDNVRWITNCNGNQLVAVSFQNNVGAWTGTANVTKISLTMSAANAWDTGSRFALMRRG
jgi:hypothetical protein